MDPARVQYLDEVLNERMLFHTQGWGILGINTATHAEGKTPQKLRIKDAVYERGLGTHAGGEIVLTLDGQYETFEAEIGVLWQGGNVGSVIFRVLVNDEVRFDSGVLRESDSAKPVSVSVKGAQLLRLVVTDAGDGITCDCANWAEARLITDPEAATRPQAPQMDVAPFATVATWDPKRMDGARANRVQEFAPEDVYLHSELMPDEDGLYTVPTVADGAGCIGLQWVERRLVKRVAIEFASMPPAPEGVALQRWVGESWWQGSWQPVTGDVRREGSRWEYDLSWRDAPADQPKTTQKVRWVFSPTAAAVRVRALEAYTRAAWDEVELRLEREGFAPEARVEVGVYNGAFVTTDGSQSLEPLRWASAEPLGAKVRFSRPMLLKSDRTVLRFRVPGREGAEPLGFSVAIEDVLKSGCVYVPAAGVYVTRADNPVTLAQHKDGLAGRRTIRERVRSMPDQTFASAMEHVHNPVQDLGPMLVSLACENHKFQVQRDGAIQFSTVPDDPRSGVVHYPVELKPTFGSGAGAELSRRLYGNWLPVPETSVTEGQVTYSQRTFVAPFDDGPPQGVAWWFSRRPLCVAEYSVRNAGDEPVAVSLALAALADAPQGKAADIEAVSGGAVIRDGDRLLAFIDTSATPGLTTAIEGGRLTLRGELGEHGYAKVAARVPGWELGAGEYVALQTEADLLARTQTYWERLLAEAAQVEVPDPLLSDIIRASQVHCLIAARSEQDGAQIAPWIGSDRYGPLESEANSIILGMDYLGHTDFSRRCLEHFIGRYNPAGYLTTGYTLMGTGWHLWTLAEHFALTHDDAWLRQVAPKVAGACGWIAAQREKTRRLRPNGEKEPMYGLMPPGVVADWGMYANRFYMDGHFCAGLSQTADALVQIGHPLGAKLRDAAAEYRAQILEAYRWTQERTPVRLRGDGTWAPAAPGMAYCFGTVGEFFPGEDWGRTWAGDVEIGPHHLAALELMDAGNRDTDWALDEMEDVWCLETGMGDYPAEKSREDWFNLGGFAKVQPYYARMTDVYAQRDEVKPYIRSYFNAIPSLVSLENLSFWEHFHNVGGWNKTHETGAFLQQTRKMLVLERGSELWLAPFVTGNWLQDGMHVGLHNAPTRFGAVSYRLRSSVNQGFIEAQIDPPTRSAPIAIVLRVRHPEGKPMQRVTVNGRPHADFDAQAESIRLTPGAERIEVKVEF